MCNPSQLKVLSKAYVPFEKMYLGSDSQLVKVHAQNIVKREEELNGSLCPGSDFPGFLATPQISWRYFIC